MAPGSGSPVNIAEFAMPVALIVTQTVAWRIDLIYGKAMVPEPHPSGWGNLVATRMQEAPRLRVSALPG